jgi:hypothetical protein
VNFGKISFLDRGQKMLNLNRELERIQLCDLNKEKVISEYDIQSPIDFTPVTGNQSEILQTNQFNSVSNQSILQHDL